MMDESEEETIDPCIHRRSLAIYFKSNLLCTLNRSDYGMCTV